jgi:hypothetical protein
MSIANKLPNEIFVYWVEDGGSAFLSAFDDLVEAAESADEKTLIGTYVLEHQAKYGIDKTINEL